MNRVRFEVKSLQVKLLGAKAITFYILTAVITCPPKRLFPLTPLPAVSKISKKQTLWTLSPAFLARKIPEGGGGVTGPEFTWGQITSNDGRVWFFPENHLS